ncbi:MAG: hypothetical protein FJ102_02365 [Deltaproteobacteria bacterium]|nr:hypothetical protein [Deltaproteobacteria bacterium]
MLALVRVRTGRLVALTLSAPATLSSTELAPRVQDQLRRAGLGEVAVEVRQGGGPLRVVAAEFER